MNLSLFLKKKTFILLKFQQREAIEGVSVVSNLRQLYILSFIGVLCFTYVKAYSIRLDIENTFVY